MKWTQGPGWHMQSSGDYAITKHAIADKPGSFYYLGYWRQDLLCQRASADEVRDFLRQHNGKRQ